jgi:hypothetical protein
MTFFYDLNKRLADLAKKQDLTESAQPAIAEGSTGDYSAKKARAGKDIGKPGKMFSKIAKSAGKEYGSKAAGERVAGAVLNKLRAKESVSEGQMKQAMHKDAERMSLDKFVAKYGNESWVRDFYNNTVGPVDETASKASTSVRNTLAPYAEEIADILDQGRMAVLDDNFLDNPNDIEQYTTVLLKMSNLFRRNPMKGLEYLGTLWSEIQEMVIGEVRDQLKIDLGQMYNQAFPNTGRSFEESAFQAAIGKKKYGADGMKALQKAGREQASDKTMNTIRNRYDKYNEGITDEGNEFSGELAQARASGAKQFKVDGKSYPVKEAGAPMTPKQKSFAKLAPPVDKITFADKIAGAKKEVDEMLGDVAAEAIKKAVKKSEPRSKGTAFDPEVLKTMTSTDKHPRYDVKDTGYSKRYTRKVQDEPTDDDEKSDAPKVKGRPKGSKRAIGAKGPTGKSKLMSKDAIKEVDMDPADHGEYDREGDMAKEQMHTIMSAAKELHGMLKDEENLPEWVQKKITLAKEYIDTARDYMATQHAERAEEEPIAEKAVSKKQQKFMGMVHAAQKGERPASGAVAKVAKGMGKKDAKDFAATKHKGLPEKVKEEGTDKEDQHAERAGKKVTKDLEYDMKHKGKDDSKAERAGKKVTKDIEYDDKKDKVKESNKGGYNFGGGVYESLDRKFQQALTEGMNVSVNMSTGQDGEPTKNITISADGEDADRLADLLKMAGIQGHGQESCQSCGQTPCGCESLDENSPDWPTNTETSDDAMQYSGGLNGPKSTGQSTTPVLASQLRRQVSMEEGVKIEQSLFKLYNQYKLK